jgi:hypothetical protein
LISGLPIVENGQPDADEVPRHLLEHDAPPVRPALRAILVKWSQSVSELRRLREDNDRVKRQHVEHLGFMRAKMDGKIKRIIEMHEKETNELIAAYERELRDR